MSFNHYYQSELTALRQLGRRFAERSPALAPFLGEAGRDPDVERLLEGMAFLTGRLRQKLDDELPELSHSLMHLLWPNYMRPLPAFSMLQFDPLKAAGPAFLVDRDTPVEGIASQGERCRFQTCYPTQVLPLALCAMSYSAQGEGGLLSLRLGMSCDGHLGEVALESLRLHLAGERYISQMLYLGLVNNLEGFQLVVLDANNMPLSDGSGRPLVFELPAANVRAVGFAEEEALIPYPLNTFRGYRLIQEYFAFQDKFLFVDVMGLEVLKTLPDTTLEQVRGFELRFNIHKCSFPLAGPTLDNLKLFCTPIVNLFKHDALPIRLDGRQDEYWVIPAEYEPGNCAVFSIDKVTGWQPGGQGYQDYVPFESFEHDSSFDATGTRPSYSVRQHASLRHEGLDTCLSLGGHQPQAQETLSVELTCTNQNLPRQLKLGDINQACEQTPAFLTFRDITPATSSYTPPQDQGFLWRVISNMSLNYLSLANVEALKVILQTYDFASFHDRQAQKVSERLLGGLQSIHHEHVDRLHRGLPLRGLRTELCIDSHGYIGEGDVFVFGSVLNEFFALYASLNSFHELRINSTHGEVYQWPPRMGQQPLL